MRSIYSRHLRPLLFSLDPEMAHELAGSMGVGLSALPGMPELLSGQFRFSADSLKQNLVGVDFPNPVGLAAGFDKTGELFPFLEHLGFGFIESGTFTANIQPGNVRPRLFRFPEEGALVNRMGFNNPGAVAAAAILGEQRRNIPRGINVGKSKATPLKLAGADYAESISRLARFGDYLAINISSPNTPGLRELQGRSALRELLLAVKEAIAAAGALPLFVKIAPDITPAELDMILAVLLEMSVDGVIISNTTVERDEHSAARAVPGGLSGRPLRERSCELVRQCYRAAGDRLVIVGVGGIFNGDDVIERLRAGAHLVQVYTGFVYGGPWLPGDLNRHLAGFLEAEGLSLSELRGSGA
ncbi:MAG: quinone-dependent dihydroorotate dehydrogenase [Spirochaetales bacterium]|nr:quinone-dependent dihydroorotate dehydrogenase [Spirochaetales bacterium]